MKLPKGNFRNDRLFELILWSVIALNVAWLVIQVVAIFYPPLRQLLNTPI